MPLPNAGGVPGKPAATTRERFRQQSTTPSATAATGYIDDVGFGLERFSPIGGYRDHENGLPIDDSGDLNDRGGLAAAPAPLHQRRRLGWLAQSPRAQACFVRQYLQASPGGQRRRRRRPVHAWTAW